MRVQLKEKIGHDPRHVAGSVVDVDETTGKDWVLRDLAEETSAKKTAIREDGTPDLPAPETDDSIPHPALRDLKDLKGEAARIAQEKMGVTGHTGHTGRTPDEDEEAAEQTRAKDAREADKAAKTEVKKKGKK